MKSLARRIAALTVTAALLSAQWPASAWAGPGGNPADPTPAEAMAFFQSIGVLKSAADPLKGYLGSDSKLTPIGRTLYLSMKRRYNPAEHAEAMQPVFERLRAAGPYNESRQSNVAKVLSQFESKFGSIDDAQAGSVEQSYRAGALLEALMTGASISDPPPKNAYMQVETKDGYEFWDRDGLAFRMTKNQVTTYNRELQKTQRLMNMNRPSDVAQIPETGRYNFEMLAYSYYRLKAQQDEYVRAARIDRMAAMAELLGEQLPNDAYFGPKSEERERKLIEQAKAKTYSHRGETYSVFDIVDAKFEQRRFYIAGSTTAVARFESDMERFKAAKTITDAQVATMSLNEQNALRWLSLTVLETQMFHVRNQRERVDPTSPDAQMVMTMIDEMEGLTPAEKGTYKDQGNRMKDRLESLRVILDDVRAKLNAADYAGSLDMVQAALGSTQKELSELSTDYAIYLEAPSTAYLAQTQSYDGWNPIKHGVRWIRGRIDSQYRDDMAVIEGRGSKPSMSAQYLEFAKLVAGGKQEDWAEARRRIIAMNPGSEQYVMNTSPTGDTPKPNDALRISSSLKVAHDKLNYVTPINKTNDAISNFVTFTVSLALLAPVIRPLLNLTGRLSGPSIKLIQKGAEMGFVKGFFPRVIGRTGLFIGEISKHTAARLKSLEPGKAQVAKYGGETLVGRYAAASGMRAVNVAARQASFTALSGVISGMFTVGTHYWDQARGNQSMFADDFSDPDHNTVLQGGGLFGKGARDAFVAGFKGGAWWANESFHPGLGYIGLPSTVFAGSRWSGAMEVIGSRGVVGSTMHGMKVMVNGSAAVEAAAAQRTTGGLLERMMESKWYTGKPLAAFTLSMADNVAKYALFSHGAGWLGEKWGWHVSSNLSGNLPAVDESVMTPEQIDARRRDEAERRIKTSNKTGQSWLESPAWLLIPTHAAHAAAEAAPYMRSREGAKQFDEAGRTGEYASKPSGHLMDFIKPPKPPVSQMLFEAHFFGDPPPTKWAVTDQVRLAGYRKMLVRMLAGPGGKIEDIPPLEFYRMTKLKDNHRFVDVYMNDEVRLVAHQDFVDALLARAEATKKALEVKPGSVVEGLGRITPELQLDIAVALYTAEGMAGKKVPAALSKSVNKLLEPFLEANKVVEPFAKAFIEAVNKTPVKAPKLDAVLSEMKEAVREWARENAEVVITPYSELVTKLSDSVTAKVKAGELSATEGALMTKLYDYVLAIERRFNSFNKVETVMGLNGTTIEALKVEFAGKGEVNRILKSFSDGLEGWARTRKGQAVDGPKADGEYAVLMSKFANEVKNAEGKLTLNETGALTKAINDMTGAPWVLRDSKGTALSSWRPAQFVSFIESLSEVAAGESGADAAAVEAGLAPAPGARGGNAIRQFQMLTTGGGKTMLTFEGLLPLAEADAAARKMEVTFLTVQSNLEAQARMEFIAFRKIGSKLTFDTYEGFKSKIAEGKTKGKNALKRYWILGDEMDGAALQPALTIGQTSGFVTRKNGVGLRLEEIDGILSRLLERGRIERATNILTEARRLTTLFENLSESQVANAREIKAEIAKLERAAGRINAGGRQEALLAESTVRESMARVRELLDAVPSREGESVATAKQSLARMDKAIDSPQLSKELREAALVELQNGLKEQSLLFGLVKAENGFGELPVEARKARVSLEAKIERLEAELGAAESSGAKGAKLRAEGLRQELELAKMEKTLVERFEAVDASSRLIKIEEQIAAIEHEAQRPRPAPRDAKLEGLKLEAAKLEAALTVESVALRAGRSADLSKAAELKKQIGDVEFQIRTGARAGKPVEALEAKLESLKAERKASLDAAGAKEKALSSDPAALELGKLESRIRQFEPVEAPAGSGDKLARLKSEAAGLESMMSPETAAAHAKHRAQLNRVHEIGLEMHKADGEVLAASAKGDKAAETAARERLTQLETERANVRAAIKSMEIELGSGATAGDLGGMIRRSQSLGAEIARLEGLAEAAKAKGARAGPIESEIAKLKKQDGALHREIKKEVQRRFEAAGDEIAAIVKKGDPGWEIAAQRLLQRRRALLESFTAEENPMYKLYREMREDAWPIAHNEMLLEGASKIKDSVEGLKSLAEQLAAYEKNPGGPAGEALPFLKEASRYHAEMKARVAELEVKFKEAEASKETSATAKNLRRGEFERAQLELQLVERFLALEAPGGAKPAEPFALKEALAKLDRLSVEADAVTADAARNLKRRIDGDPFSVYLPKLIWRTMTGKPMEIQETGLTRQYAMKMLKALFQEPMMDLTLRDNLMWSFLGSLAFPKGVGHRANGSSWVRTEFINMVQGYHENPAGVRLDGRNNKFNVVHNGQWFESMDNATRRWWEVEYGVDLTLPYSHQSISTIKDVTTFKGARFISLSGTAGRKFEAHMREAGVRVSGKGSVMPGTDIPSETPYMDVVASPAQRFTRIKEALLSVLNLSKDRVVLKPTDLAPLREAAKAGDVGAGATVKALEAHMAANRLKGQSVIEIGKVESPEAQAFLRNLRAGQKDTGLVVLSVSDTRVLKVVIEYLKRSGIKADEIAKVFSDSEYLRINAPEAKVAEQMNLSNLDKGKIKVLILDTRVGGRGLDLNFKGDRSNPSPDAFRGYTNMEMLVIDPQAMSQVHLLQAMGRIDRGRILAGTSRTFSLVMDVPALKHDAFFRRMFVEDPVFAELRKDPAVQRYALSKGQREVTLPLIHEFVMSREAQSGEGLLLAERYREAMKKTLERRQAEVESDQLRSSSVLQDRPSVSGKYPGLEMIR